MVKKDEKDEKEHNIKFIKCLTCGYPLDILSNAKDFRGTGVVYTCPLGHKAAFEVKK